MKCKFRIKVSAKLVECLIALSESSNFRINETREFLKPKRIKRNSREKRIRIKKR